MLRIERVLCPVDFSEYSDRAYDYAHSLARHYGAKLFVQHVTEPVLSLYRGYMSPSLLDELYAHQTADAHEAISKLAARHEGEKIEPEVLVEMGAAADSILKRADQEDIDLIVMGTHGRQGLDRLTVGSTTERVIRRARCAVLAIREPERDFIAPASPDEPVRLRKILWCTDFSESSPRALEYALSLAFQYHAEITLLHVLEGSGADEQSQQALERLRDVIPDDARDWATVVPAVRTGRPYEEIIAHAAETQTDVIVMGVRGRNVLNLSLFGSTTHRVLQIGPCPVLVVRT